MTVVSWQCCYCRHTADAVVIVLQDQPSSSVQLIATVPRPQAQRACAADLAAPEPRHSLTPMHAGRGHRYLQMPWTLVEVQPLKPLQPDSWTLKLTSSAASSLRPASSCRMVRERMNSSARWAACIMAPWSRAISAASCATPHPEEPASYVELDSSGCR